MNNYLKKLSFLLTLSLALAFSCAGKKQISDEGKTSGIPSEQGMSEEGTSSDQGMGMGSMDKLARVYFDFNDATLRADAREALKNDAQVLKNNPNMNVSIEGHCDERGSVEYNLALGERRAESIKSYLTKLGISPSRMTTISYGEEKPLVYGHSEEAWSKNRRGEINPQ